MTNQAVQAMRTEVDFARFGRPDASVSQLTEYLADMFPGHSPREIASSIWMSYHIPAPVRVLPTDDEF